MTPQYPGLKIWCKIAAEQGYTHLLAADGTKTPLQDIVNGKIRTPHAPAGCFWAGDGASSEFRVVLYSNNSNKRLGHYKFTKEPADPFFPMIPGEGAPQYTFDVKPNQQLSLL